MPVAQAPVAQLEVAAAAMAQVGHRYEALSLAEKILLRDPENALAHFIVAREMLAEGKTDIAREAAARSFAGAGTDRQRYEAAVLAAKVAVTDKRWISAQYWARHSIQYAPDAALKDVAVQDYYRLRGESPLNWSLRLGLRPSSNVNGGADSRLNVIDGYDAVGVLSDDALALSGLVGTLNFDASYRIAGSARAETRLGGSFYLRGVELSGSPTMTPSYLPGDPVPDPVEISNSDYSMAALGVSLKQRYMLDPLTQLSGTVEAGQLWDGGEPGYGYAGVHLRGDRRLGGAPDATRLSLGLGVERREWNDSVQSDTRRDLTFGLTRSVPGGDLSGSMRLLDVASNNGQARSWSVSGSLRYEPEARLGPLAYALSAGIGRTVYPDYSVLWMHPDGGRQDQTVFGEVGMWAPDYGYAGFTPELRVQALRVDSNVSRFTRSEMSLAVGLRSNF
ncbi:hypothetical protein LZA78_05940 [Sinirhodobacter sp. WL0062]|uniref:DUF560 domain-containing protein n=1 Tax=Rhodobacter flavimaris TaxID=2907145 RepID=A0ABS8YUU4_9RHOB|nr:hypothetical protein [Sinirhodobacter sp. WL0062]MCE5973015.1 hypothetical protein [Sinirhodobacter sp. WL0062]